MLSNRGILPFRSLSCSKVLYNKKPKFQFGLDKIERRHLKRRLAEAHSSLGEKHIYKTSFKVNSKLELAELLTSNELYNEGGLIALPKPFGIPRKKIEESPDPKKVIQTLNSAGNVSDISIQEILPLLKRHYKTSYLDVVFYPERYTSGILLLSKNETLSKRVDRCIRRSLAFNEPYQSYTVVTLGKPTPETTTAAVGTNFHYVHNIGKIPVIKMTPSKTKIKKGEIKKNFVQHSVMVYNEELDVALVELNVMNLKHHFLRVWMTHCYASILGDLICGGRVKTVLGQKILVSPNNLTGYEPPVIPKKILSKLNLSTPQQEIIPTHIHQSKLTLHRFDRSAKSPDLVISAPPPDLFMWTCFQLSLLDPEYFVNDLEEEEFGDMEDYVVEPIP